MSLFETYYAYYALFDLNTGETIMESDPNENTGSFRSILEMTQETKAMGIIRELRSNEHVDNISVHYKSDIGPKSAWMGITYREYSENETPNYSDPNRMYVFFVESESEIIRIQRQYGGDKEAFKQAVIEGRE